MITAQVVGYWQGVNLETGASTSKVTIRLPGGLEKDLEVPKDYLSTLLDATEPSVAAVAAITRIREPEQEPEQAAEDLDTPEESTESAPMLELVNWSNLPSEILPDHVKFALRDQGLPDRMPAAQVLQIRDAFLAEYTTEDWQRIISKYSVVPSSASEKEAQEEAEVPKIGSAAHKARVAWGEGSVMSPSVPTRTVPKDNLGYPIVTPRTADVDVGEIASDDDAVESL